MSHDSVQFDVAEQAALYAAGLLSSAELDAFEERLLAREPEHVAQFERVRGAGEMLMRVCAAGGDQDEPALLVRSNIINAMGVRRPGPALSFNRKEDPRVDDASALIMRSDDSADWQDSAVPGVKTRRLFVDRERRRVTMLIKAAPGVAFPDHDHADVEECLVLDGDIELAGKTLHKMDYMRIPKGGQHGTPRTRSGCLLLVTCALVEAA
jgi:anti-sigma factor ChrR (cupin superfamily)